MEESSSRRRYPHITIAGTWMAKRRNPMILMWLALLACWAIGAAACAAPFCM